MGYGTVACFDVHLHVHDHDLGCSHGRVRIAIRGDIDDIRSACRACLSHCAAQHDLSHSPPHTRSHRQRERETDSLMAVGVVASKLAFQVVNEHSSKPLDSESAAANVAVIPGKSVWRAKGTARVVLKLSEPASITSLTFKNNGSAFIKGKCVSCVRRSCHRLLKDRSENATSVPTNHPTSTSPSSSSSPPTTCAYTLSHTLCCSTRSDGGVRRGADGRHQNFSKIAYVTAGLISLIAIK